MGKILNPIGVPFQILLVGNCRHRRLKRMLDGCEIYEESLEVDIMTMSVAIEMERRL